MNTRYLAVILTTTLPVLSAAQAAQNYQCSYGDMQRRIEIVYETGVTVPCEVHYFKDTEAPGEREVLWRALNQAGYCEEKTEGFVSQLQEWGWACTASNPAAPAEEAPGEDDTEALEPAEH